MALYNADGALCIDNTILTAFAECSTRAMLEYGYDLSVVGRESLPAKAGQAVHFALESYLLDGNQERALARFHNHYAGTEAPDGDRLQYDNVELILKDWMNRHPLDTLPFVVEETELPFAIPLDSQGTIMYTGRIDAIVRPRQGDKLYVLDTKSTGRLDALFKRQFVLSPQLTGYVWAAQQLYAPRRIAGAWINAIDMSKVPQSDRTCKRHKQTYKECGLSHLNHEWLGPFHRSPLELDAWYQDALIQAESWREFVEAYGGDKRAIQYVPQEGKWKYQACVKCQFYEFCATGRPLHAMTTTMEHRQWNPLGEV